MRQELSSDRWLEYVVCLVMLFVISACATGDPTRIQLDRSVHFVTADGKDVEVPSGTYRVEQAAGAQIRLVPGGNAPPFVLDAETVQSEVRSSIAMAVPFEPDAYDVILLVPGGSGLVTHGSVSGVQSRAVVGVNPTISLSLQAALAGPDLVGPVQTICDTSQDPFGRCTKA